MVEEAQYLGYALNRRNDAKKELSKRTASSMAVLQKLNEFWPHSSCATKFKITVADAVFKSKLLYGLESSQLTPETKRRLDTLQLKALRKILHFETTYIDRANTNDKVLTTARRRTKKHIETFSTAYIRKKLTLLEDILAAPDTVPEKEATLAQGKLTTHTH